MNKIFRSLIIVTGVVFLLIGTLSAQTKVIKEVNASNSTSWDGATLYKEYCAVCHGNEGQGNGPAASALKVKPNDLTLMAKQNGGKFDTLHMQMVIKGDKNVEAHGIKDMPMWGNVFRSMSANQAFGEMRINALIDYLKKIQK